MGDRPDRAAVGVTRLVILDLGSGNVPEMSELVNLWRSWRRCCNVGVGVITEWGGQLVAVWGKPDPAVSEAVENRSERPQVVRS